jgi:CRISPR-associated protein Csb2
MLEHYGIENGGKPDGARVWRTVTPAALPLRAARGRIDPGRLNAELKAARSKMGAPFEEVKSSTERRDEEGRAAAAIVQALRHTGVPVRPERIRVQREPFEGRGARAEAFGNGTRFAKKRLWHAEIVFVEPVIGPLVIGDGRYLGLGIMALVHDACREMLVFAVPQAVKIAAADTSALIRATRRALMALSREATGRVPRLFSGHETNGERAASGHHEHVFIAADDSNGDGYVDRLIVASPWVCDRTAWTYHWQRRTFDEVASRLENVRVGPLGRIRLGPPRTLDDGDPLIGPPAFGKAARHI